MNEGFYMEKNYEYPIDLDWSREDMINVVELWRQVELAYEKGIDREEFLKQYRLFKQVIPSKGEEKRWSKQFEDSSGYSLYRVVKAAKESEQKKIQL